MQNTISSQKIITEQSYLKPSLEKCPNHKTVEIIRERFHAALSAYKSIILNILHQCKAKGKNNDTGFIG